MFKSRSDKQVYWTSYKLHIMLVSKDNSWFEILLISQITLWIPDQYSEKKPSQDYTKRHGFINSESEHTENLPKNIRKC